MPVDFCWGISLSALGCEGAAPESDWARYEREGRASPSLDGNGWRTNFRDDIAMYAAMGCRALRIGIEWARVEPRPGVINGEAVDVYHEMLRATTNAGLKIWLTLHDQSLPGWFGDDEQGFRDERARRYFWPRHVDRCAELFDEHADAWVLMEDPVGYVSSGYYRGTCPPGRRGLESLREGLLGVIDALVHADRLLRGTSVVLPLGLSDPHGRRGRAVDAPATAWAVLAARRTGRIEIAELPTLLVPDFVDVGSTVGVRHFAQEESAEELADCVYRAADEAPNTRLAITANGYRTNDDDQRDAYLHDAGRRIDVLRSERVPIDAYFHHTGVDAYDSLNGFSVANGLFKRDRTPKNSAARFERLISR